MPDDLISCVSKISEIKIIIKNPLFRAIPKHFLRLSQHRAIVTYINFWAMINQIYVIKMTEENCVLLANHNLRDAYAFSEGYA